MANNVLYLGNLIGATGPTGPSVAGAAGPRGATGPAGADGSPGGATGPIGLTGATGPTGPASIFKTISTSSINLANTSVGDTLTLTVEEGKSWSAGQTAVVTSSNLTYAGEFFLLEVTSYSGTSLVGEVVHISGTSTIANWIINLSAAMGLTGATGPTGPSGGSGSTGPTGPRGPLSFSGAGNSSIAMPNSKGAPIAELNCMGTDIFHVKVNDSGQIRLQNMSPGQKVYVLVEMTSVGVAASAVVSWQDVRFNSTFSQVSTAGHATLYEIIKIGTYLLGKYQYDYDLT